MHGNTPYAGAPAADAEPTPEHRRALRRELVSVAASTRDLLSDEFVVGGEVADGGDGSLRATIAIRPPAGGVVSAGLDPEENTETVARKLAAGAVFEAKRAGRDVKPTAG